MELEHISEMTSADTGGGFVIDLLTLKDGRVVGISEDSIVLYDNLDDFEKNEGRERPMIGL